MSCFNPVSAVKSNLICGAFAAHITEKLIINQVLMLTMVNSPDLFSVLHLSNWILFFREKNIFKGRYFYYSIAFLFILNCIYHVTDIHKYVYVCSVSWNGTAVKHASRFWGSYFLCSLNWNENGTEMTFLNQHENIQPAPQAGLTPWQGKV